MAARYYLENSEAAQEILRPGRMGYLRGATLSQFNGERWARSTLEAAPTLPELRGDSIALRVLYEANEHESVAVPLGTFKLQKEGAKPREQPRFQADRTWRDPHDRGRRREYHLEFSPRVYALDAPASVEMTRVPSAWRDSRFSTLVSTLFPKRGAKPTAGTAIQTVEGYFRAQGLRASLSEQAAPPAPQSGLTRLEYFLFTSKAGHCEAFAASAALLIRGAGIPARLVAGYRLSRPANQGILTIRSGDAHAWVEAWDESSHRWISYDPTPRILYLSGSLDAFRDFYDFASAQWYRFLTNYSQGAQSSWQLGDMTLSATERWKWLAPRLNSEIEWGRWLGAFAAAAGVLSLLWGVWFLKRASRWHTKNGSGSIPLWLVRERMGMERMIRAAPWRARSAHYQAWNELYLRARFSREAQSLPLAWRPTLRDLRRRVSVWSGETEPAPRPLAQS